MFGLDFHDHFMGYREMTVGVEPPSLNEMQSGSPNRSELRIQNDRLTVSTESTLLTKIQGCTFE